eukprot:GHVQ01011129.1.p1 GENE.GHVQ01011129.1~~GHVQ01011129.1.p1  ORF type:complete len:324 (+),score=82.04 GHVQ01011129.1:233-1204(+)
MSIFFVPSFIILLLLLVAPPLSISSSPVPSLRSFSLPISSTSQAPYASIATGSSSSPERRLQHTGIRRVDHRTPTVGGGEEALGVISAKARVRQNGGGKRRSSFDYFVKSTRDSFGTNTLEEAAMDDPLANTYGTKLLHERLGYKHTNDGGSGDGIMMSGGLWEDIGGDVVMSDLPWLEEEEMVEAEDIEAIKLFKDRGSTAKRNKQFLVRGVPTIDMSDVWQDDDSNVTLHDEDQRGNRDSDDDEKDYYDVMRRKERKGNDDYLKYYFDSRGDEDSVGWDIQTEQDERLRQAKLREERVRRNNAMFITPYNTYAPIDTYPSL